MYIETVKVIMEAGQRVLEAYADSKTYPGNDMALAMYERAWDKWKECIAHAIESLRSPDVCRSCGGVLPAPSLRVVRADGAEFCNEHCAGLVQ